MEMGNYNKSARIKNLIPGKNDGNIISGVS